MVSWKKAVSVPAPGGICCFGDLVCGYRGDERKKSGEKAIVGQGVTNSV